MYIIVIIYLPMVYIGILLIFKNKLESVIQKSILILILFNQPIQFFFK